MKTKHWIILLLLLLINIPIACFIGYEIGKGKIIDNETKICELAQEYQCVIKKPKIHSAKFNELKKILEDYAKSDI